MTMFLRRLLTSSKACSCKLIPPSSRCMSNDVKPLVDLTVDNDGIAIVTLQRAPVNSLNLDLLQELSKTLDELNKTKARGMVLTSALPTVFSAGLDLMEMYQGDPKRLEEMSKANQDCWLKLFGSSFPTAAAINGHAPAGGCMQALACEYRVMVSGDYTIGLNETAVGISATDWLIESMKYTISPRHAEIALTTSKIFNVNEALQIGLIDEIASDKADAINKCKNFLKKFHNISPTARAITKDRCRQSTINVLLETRERDTQSFLKLLLEPSVQETLGEYIANLKRKSALKKQKK